MTQKNNILADAVHFFRTEIDSIDFKNQNLTAKIRRNKAQKPYFKKIYIPTYLQTDETIKQNKYLKNIGKRNK